MTRRLPRRWATIHIPTIAKPITWLYPFVCACFKDKLHVTNVRTPVIRVLHEGERSYIICQNKI